MIPGTRTSGVMRLGTVPPRSALQTWAAMLYDSNEYCTVRVSPGQADACSFPRRKPAGLRSDKKGSTAALHRSEQSTPLFHPTSLGSLTLLIDGRHGQSWLEPASNRRLASSVIASPSCTRFQTRNPRWLSKKQNVPDPTQAGTLSPIKRTK